MRRPSPAMVVALVALVAACAGSATAATLITGAQIRDNSVSSADVRNGSLRGRDVRANTIRGRNVSGLSGRDVIRNGLDGSDLDENTLDPVPAAQRAASAASADALAKARLVRLDYRQAAEAAPQTLYDEGGLLVQASCSAAGRLTARATPTTAGGGSLRVTVAHPGTPAETTLLTDNAFEGADVASLVAGGADNAAGSLTYRAPSGDVTTMHYLAHEGGACVLGGNAVHTEP